MQKKKRMVGLDYFRITAALVTFLFHSVLHLGCNYGIMQEFLSMGAVVMTGFFILSGFSLFCVYKELRLMEINNWKVYIKKRAIGIFPAYLVAGFAFMICIGSESILQNIVLLPVEVLGIQACFSSLFPISHNGGTWFISCLLICYLVFPYILEMVKQINIKMKICLILFASAILLYSPIVVYYFGLNWTYTNPYFRGLEFLIGVVLASMMEDLLECKVIKKYLFSVIAIVMEAIIMVIGVSIAVKLDISFGNYMLYSWICLPLFILMIPALAQLDIKQGKIVAYASAISYDFFLVQFFVWPIVRKLKELVSMNNVVTIIVSLMICIGLSIVTHEVIEKPSKRLFRKG